METSKVQGDRQEVPAVLIGGPLDGHERTFDGELPDAYRTWLDGGEPTEYRFVAIRDGVAVFSCLKAA